MVEKFEVGKSYIAKSIRSVLAVPFTVVYAGEFKAFVQSDDGPEFTIPHGDAEWYDEYVEPKIDIVKKIVTRDASGYVACIGQGTGQLAVLGEIEITIIGGKMDSVRIL